METQVVKFYGDDISVNLIEGHPYFAVTTVANAIGLNPKSALTGIKNDEILGQLVIDGYSTGADNKQYLMQLLPTEYLTGWLFSIDISKVKEEIKPKLILYKRECYKVLNNHFFGKHKVVSDSHIRLAEICARVREIDSTCKDLSAEKKELLIEKSQIECDNFRQLGIDFETPQTQLLLN